MYIVDLIVYCLSNNKDLIQGALKSTFIGYVRSYAEVDIIGKNIWANRKKSKFIKNVSILKSINAKKLLDSGKFDDIYLEHITPVSLLVKSLLQLENITSDSVAQILIENELVMLTKEEAKVLDGNKNKLYSLDNNQVNGLGLRSIGSKEERLVALKNLGIKFE